MASVFRSFWVLICIVGCTESSQPLSAVWPQQLSALEVQQTQIAFAMNDTQVRWGPDVLALKKLVLARGKADEKLVVIGLFRPQERATHQGIDLGYLRANAAKALFAELPAERIDVESMKSTDTRPDAPLIRLEWRAVIAPIFPAPQFPLAFAAGSAIPITSEQLGAFVEALGTGMPDQRLEITIRYFADETEELAQQRAAAVQQLLEPAIAADRTLVLLRREGAWPYGDKPGELTQFRWIQ